MGEMWNRNMAFAVCVFMAFVLYYETIKYEFTYDDNIAVVQNPDVLGKNSTWTLLENDFWGNNMLNNNSHKSYRPIVTLSFRLNHFMSGMDAWSFHAGNVMLHVISTAWVFIATKMIMPYDAHTPTTMLFAIHPIHTESVASIVGRADVMCNIFFLLSFVFYVLYTLSRNNVAAKYGTVTKANKISSTNLKKLQWTKNWENWRYAAKASVPKEIECNARREARPFRYYLSVMVSFLYFITSVVFGTLATFCKEIGITSFMVNISYDIIRSYVKRRHIKTKGIWKSWLFQALSMIMVMGARLYISGGVMPSFSTADNQVAKSDCLMTRFLTLAYLPTFSFGLLLYPAKLCFDWGMGAIPLVKTIEDVRNWQTAVFFFVLILSVYVACIISGGSRLSVTEIIRRCPIWRWCFRRRRNRFSLRRIPLIVSDTEDTISFSEAFLYSVVFLVIPYLPSANVLFYTGFMVAERTLYIPSIGFCMMIGLAFSYWRKRMRGPIVSDMLMIYLVSMSFMTIIRNPAWANEESLYRSALDINPAKACGNLGVIRLGKGDLVEAESLLVRAIKLYPTSEWHFNLGKIYDQTGRIKKAKLQYNMTLQMRVNFPMAYVNYGALLARTGDLAKARQLFLHCWDLPDVSINQRDHTYGKKVALIQLGRLHMENGRFFEAARTFRLVLDRKEFLSEYQWAYNYMGVAYMLNGRFNESEKMFRFSIVNNKEAETVTNLGYMLTGLDGRELEGESHMLNAISQDNMHSSLPVYLYGVFLIRQGRHAEAVEILKPAIDVRPNDYELLRLAAHAYRKCRNWNDAEELFHRAITLHSTIEFYEDVLETANYGSVLLMTRKYDKALKLYEMAIAAEDDFIKMQERDPSYIEYDPPFRIHASIRNNIAVIKDIINRYKCRNCICRSERAWKEIVIIFSEDNFKAIVDLPYTRKYLAFQSKVKGNQKCKRCSSLDILYDDVNPHYIAGTNKDLDRSVCPKATKLHPDDHYENGKF